MKKMNSIALFVVISVIFAFHLPREAGNMEVKTGTYGICSYGESEDRGSAIMLCLKEDHSFEYCNNMDPDKAVKVNGTWKIEEGILWLENGEAEMPIARKWKIDGENCLKSRKGFKFMRICHLKSCE